MTQEKDELDLFQVFGRTGLKNYSGIVNEEFLEQLKHEKGTRMYREMAENDAIIGAILYAIKTLVRQVDWRIDAAEDTDDARAVADFVSECLFEDMDRTWTDTLSEILSFLVYGFSVHEITYKIRRGPDEELKTRRSKFSDGRIGWRGFPIRAQDTIYSWDLDPDGDVQGFTQLAPPDFSRRYIPAEKILHFRTESHKNNPEGRSLLRNAFLSYYYKKKLITYESIGVARDLAGIPTLEVPAEMLSSNASASQKAVVAQMKEFITRVARDEMEGVLIPSETNSDGSPSGFRLRLLNSGGRRPIDINEIIKRHESRQAITVLGEFVLLGMDKVGSFALASTKTSLFAQALGTYLDAIAEVINNHAIPKLLRLNGVSSELFPVLHYEDIETADLNELAASLASLTGAGIITPDDELEEYVRDFADLPQPQKDSARFEAAPGGADEALLPSLDGAPSVDDSEEISDDEANPSIEGSEEKPVAAVTLNGAQVSSLLSILEQVNAGTLPRDSALEVIVTSFSVTREKAESMLGSAGQ